MALPQTDRRHRSLTPEEEQERRRVQWEKNQAAIDLLRFWREGDDEDLEEQRESLEILRRALGEERPSYRKLF